MGTCQCWGCRAGKGAAFWLTWGMHQPPSAAPPHVLDAQMEAEDPSRMGLEQCVLHRKQKARGMQGPQASGFKSNGDPPWENATGLSIPGCGDRAAGRQVPQRTRHSLPLRTWLGWLLGAGGGSNHGLQAAAGSWATSQCGVD